MKYFPGFVLTVMATSGVLVPARAQIVPAEDGTGTLIENIDNPSGTVETRITGGSRSSDGRNLFQSFEQFDVPGGTTANFVTTPEVQNTIGRITGGNFSRIDGTIVLTGGNSNLFLLNPAGLVFGSAIVDVPGDFFASTASGLLFEGGLLDVAELSPDYARLTGLPLEFQFATDANGFILGSPEIRAQNAGFAASALLFRDLELVVPGSLSLVAVPGTSRVLISQPGRLLSLEVEAADLAGGLTPTEIPALIAGDILPAVTPGPEPNTVAIAGDGELPRTASTLAGSIAIAGIADITGSTAPARVRIESLQSNANSQGVEPNNRIPAIFVSALDFSGPLLTNSNVEILARGAVDLVEIADSGTIGTDLNVITNGGAIRIVESLTAFQGRIAFYTFASNGGDLIISSQRTQETSSSMRGLDLSNTFLEIDLSDGDLILEGQEITLFFSNIVPGFDGLGSDRPILTIAANDILQAAPTEALGFNPGAAIRFFTGLEIFEPVDFALSTEITLTGNLGNPNNIVTGETIELGLIGSLSIDAAGVFVESINLNTDPFVENSLGETAAAVSSPAVIAASGPAGIFIRDLEVPDGQRNLIPLTISTTDPNGNIFIGRSLGSQGSISLASQGGIAIAGGIRAGTELAISTGANAATPFNSQTASSAVLGDRAQVASLLLQGNGLDPNVPINGSLSTITTATDTLPPGQFAGDANFGTISLVATGDATAAPPTAPPPNPLPEPPVDPVGPIEPPVNPVDPIEPPQDSPPTGDNPTISDAIADIGTGIASDFVDDTRSKLQAGPPTAAIDLQLARAAEDPAAEILSLEAVQLTLKEIEALTGVRTGVLYVAFNPRQIRRDTAPTAAADWFEARETEQTAAYERYLSVRDRRIRTQVALEPESSDRLEIMLVTADAPPQLVTVEDATRGEMLALAQQFAAAAQDAGTNRYLPLSQELHRQLMGDVTGELERQRIENIVFVLPEGLRLLPVAALHDGRQFLIENYFVSVAPSITLTDATYRDYRRLGLFAAGAAEFADADSLGSLPAVPLELELLKQLWPGQFQKLFGEAFQLDRWVAARDKEPAGLVHVASHADFTPGDPAETYIQLFDRKISTADFAALELDRPAVELLVLSACRTAFGDPDNELGFSGAAIAAGAKTVVGTLWYASDAGSLALQGEFYRQLAAPQTRTKAEALARAQRAMIAGVTRFEGSSLLLDERRIPLPETLPRPIGKLAHPYYWGGFTLVGNPW